MTLSDNVCALSIMKHVDIMACCVCNHMPCAPNGIDIIVTMKYSYYVMKNSVINITVNLMM